MSEKPPPPANDDEARMDDEGSAVDHPEPAESEPKQKTKAGVEIPVSKRGEFYEKLGRDSKPDTGA
jgi:hypothetical protein